MRWILFPDGTKYTLAVDIQKTAERHGYKVPCEADGTRHPGTDCNAKMRTIFKDAGLRRSFHIVDQSVVDVKAEDSVNNREFLMWLINSGVIHNSYWKIGVIQMYSESATNALLSVMLNTAVSYTPKDDEVFECGILVTKRSHNFEKKQNKPKASLFKK